MNLRDRRIQYETAGLNFDDLDESPVQQWHAWYVEAAEAELPEPNAMAISTIDAEGMPDSRIVLVRGLDDDGLTFFGNYNSAKGQQLDANPVASAVFPWIGLHRQVRVRGTVEMLPHHESDAYFASRPRDSQLGAWASPQSEAQSGWRRVRMPQLRPNPDHSRLRRPTRRPHPGADQRGQSHASVHGVGGRPPRSRQLGRRPPRCHPISQRQ